MTCQLASRCILRDHVTLYEQTPVQVMKFELVTVQLKHLVDKGMYRRGHIADTQNET